MRRFLDTTYLGTVVVLALVLAGLYLFQYLLAVVFAN